MKKHDEEQTKEFSKQQGKEHAFLSRFHY